jgi:O-antigen/teichoic acid export membrane protein
MVLLLGIFLVIATVGLNMIFIPLYGINGSAFATFLSIFAYNIAKILFVKYAFNMMPFTMETLKTLGLILVCVGVFYFWEFPFHSIINIALKSILICAFYGYTVYTLKLSDDISSIINKLLKRA